MSSTPRIVWALVLGAGLGCSGERPTPRATGGASGSGPASSAGGGTASAAAGLGGGGRGDGVTAGSAGSHDEGTAGVAGPSLDSELSDIFPQTDDEPTSVSQEGDVIITRIAERGRRRHEPSCLWKALGEGPDTCDFENYHFMYWTHEARTFEWTIHDSVLAGKSSIVFEIDMRSPHGQNGADDNQNAPNLRCFTQYGTVTGFYQNYAMQPVGGPLASATHFRREISSYSDASAGGQSRALQAGDLMECELTLRWQELVDRGFQANYYSRRIRYVVGRGGFWGFNGDVNIGPDSRLEANLLGGRTSDSVVVAGERDRAFMQFVMNGSLPELTEFLDGRRLFHTSFVDGKHSDPGGTHDPAPAQPTFEQAALGVTPPIAEAAARCSGCHVNDGNGPVLPGMQRATPALLGMGLLEAIPVAQLLQNEAGQLLDSDPLTVGRLRRQQRGAKTLVGRFGWSGDAVSVEEQVSKALENEMGATPSALPAGFLQALSTYVRLLAVPAPRGADLWGMPGAKRFEEVGCSNCHLTRSYVTGSHPLQALRRQKIYPFTDLLQHDLGSGQELRTTPLWGVGLKATVRGEPHYLHDDSATSFDTVIEAHGGEAANSREAYLAGSEQLRMELRAFLEAL